MYQNLQPDLEQVDQHQKEYRESLNPISHEAPLGASGEEFIRFFANEEYKSFALG